MTQIAEQPGLFDAPTIPLGCFNCSFSTTNAKYKAGEVYRGSCNNAKHIGGFTSIMHEENTDVPMCAEHRPLRKGTK